MIQENTIILGDCLDVMREMPDNYFDSVITDPPYGLKFMGKTWDKGVPPIEIWREVLRVSKHGATLLCFAGTRTQHRMTCNIEDAGWRICDVIMWIYGSGFPKATDISKQIDKQAGVIREIIKIRTDGNKGGGAKTYDDDSYTWDKPFADTIPHTPEAKLWDGWKSHSIKPSYEPIIVAMKPNQSSYADNALKWGVAGLNIEECRIEGGNWVRPTTQDIRGGGFGRSQGKNNQIERSNSSGRYPANIILDEEAGKMLDEQSGNRGACAPVRRGHDGLSNGIYGDYKQKGDDGATFYSDSGGASRFFYCAKASRSERNAGLNGMPLGSPPASARSKPAEGRVSALGNPRQNHHPTVKPLKLMEYLCKLTKTPTGGIVLDPFAGSGTTGIACVNTGRNFVLIEKDPEYKQIAEARIKHARDVF